VRDSAAASGTAIPDFQGLAPGRDQAKSKALQPSVSGPTVGFAVIDRVGAATARSASRVRSSPTRSVTA
jgi:hypothetical protein